ncbi:hypothetical protein BY458DRAFT_430918 [Sporodiniella umbellata]|nr:hypothetical protein BY458DRAFT_430918 [Sporodiniella umbellata]
MPIEIPPAYLCLLASLIQDSEESLVAASSHINDILSPFMRSESLSHSFELAIQKAIKQVANYTSYGLSEQIHASIENVTGKLPTVSTILSLF